MSATRHVWARKRRTVRDGHVTGVEQIGRGHFVVRDQVAIGRAPTDHAGTRGERLECSDRHEGSEPWTRIDTVHGHIAATVITGDVVR